MATRLRGSYDRINTIKLDEVASLEDDNVIHAAIKARTIKDIREGNFENLANLQLSAGAFNAVDNNTPIVTGYRTMMDFTDVNKNVHKLSSKDPMASKFLDSPDYTLVKTYEVEVTG